MCFVSLLSALWQSCLPLVLLLLPWHSKLVLRPTGSMSCVSVHLGILAHCAPVILAILCQFLLQNRLQPQLLLRQPLLWFVTSNLLNPHLFVPSILGDLISINPRRSNA